VFLVCCCVLVTGRSALMTVSQDGAVQPLCKSHAQVQPMDHWIRFLDSFDRAGMKPCIQLTMKTSALMQLTSRAVYSMVRYPSELRCSTPGCRREPTHNSIYCYACQRTKQPSAAGSGCRTDGCRSDPVTPGGLCLMCSVRGSVVGDLMIGRQLPRRTSKQICHRCCWDNTENEWSE